MRILAHVQYGTKTIQLFRLADIGRLNLYRKRNTKYETEAKTRDKQVTYLWSNDDVYYNWNFPVL
jgi:hypothetical protein